MNQAIDNCICAVCGDVLPRKLLNRHSPQECPTCKQTCTITIFPAALEGESGQALPMKVQGSEEASCFYHSENRAERSCKRCGRFLCAHCDIEMPSGEHICKNCLENEVEEDQEFSYTTSLIRYDHLVLSMAALPVLFFPLTIITAPIALFRGLTYWRRAKHPLVRARARLAVGISLAAVQIISWLFYFSYLFLVVY